MLGGRGGRPSRSGCGALHPGHRSERRRLKLTDFADADVEDVDVSRPGVQADDKPI